LGAILGICISAGGFLGSSGDASQGLSLFASFIADPYKAQASVLLPRLLYPIFLIASVTIMLSTVHCMISAVSFTAYKDIILSKKTESIKIARLWTILIVIVGMVLYPYLRFHYLASLPTLLYGAYSAQLSLIVVAILSLLRRRLDKRAAIASVLSGFAGTVVSVVLAIRIPDPDAQVLSPLFAVFCAISGYMLFYGKKYSLNNAGMSNKDSD
jgi:Na+/proline symporter